MKPVTVRQALWILGGLAVVGLLILAERRAQAAPRGRIPGSPAGRPFLLFQAGDMAAPLASEYGRLRRL